MQIEKLRYGRAESAFSLGISVRSVDYLISSRRLPHVKDGGRILVPAAALKKYASEPHNEPIRPRKRCSARLDVPSDLA
jgi:excisionase family DNA binding protein